MNRRQKIGLGVLLGIVCIVLGLLLRQGGPAGEEQPVEKTPEIGLIDIEKAMQKHPRFAEMVELRKELNTLRAENESMQHFSAATEKTAAVDEEKISESAGNLQNQEYLMADTEAKKELFQQRRELKGKAEEELAAAIEEINAVYMPQVFNIQLKLDNLQLDDAVRKKYEADKEEVYRQREAAIRQRQQAIDEKYMALLNEKAAQAMQKLAARKAELIEQQKEQAARKVAEIEERKKQEAQDAAENAGPSRLADSGQIIEEKQRAIEALAAEIRADVEAKAMKLAAERRLQAVIAPKRHVNISAVDLTDFIIAQFNS